MASHPRVVSINCKRRDCDECALTGECLARDDDPEGDGRHDIPVTPRVFQRGEHVFRAGESFESVFMVRSGAVKTYMICPGGDEQVIGFHYPGDVIGLDAIDQGLYVSHAEVLNTSSICPLSYEKLSRLAMSSSSVHQRLMRRMSHRIKDDESLLLLLGQKNADERIAALLLGISDVQTRQGFSGVEFNLPMSRADIGSYLALAVETVSRVLTRLQTSKIIAVQRNHIKILDYDRLLEIAEGTDHEIRLAAQA